MPPARRSILNNARALLSAPAEIWAFVGAAIILVPKASALGTRSSDETLFPKKLPPRIQPLPHFVLTFACLNEWLTIPLWVVIGKQSFQRRGAFPKRYANFGNEMESFLEQGRFARRACT